MGKLDYWSKVFFEKPVNFANAFNHSLFGGRRVILPETLTSQNPKEVFQLLKHSKLYIERERDILKMATFKRGDNISYVLLGLEEQSFFDPTISLRCLFYEVLNYTEQLQKMEWKQDGTFASREEILAKFPANAKLIPIIPLVVFLSNREWPTGRRLHDILDIPSKEISRVVNDYSVHIITPRLMTDRQILRYGRELSMVLMSAKYASDNDTLQEQMKQHKRFQSMEYETARLITAITHMNNRIKKKEKIDMTQKIRAWSDYYLEKGITEGIEKGFVKGREEGRMEGRMEGSIMTMLDLHISHTQILNHLVEKFSISKEQAQNEINKLTSKKK